MSTDQEMHTDTEQIQKFCWHSMAIKIKNKNFQTDMMNSLELQTEVATPPTVIHGLTTV